MAPERNRSPANAALLVGVSALVLLGSTSTFLRLPFALLLVGYLPGSSLLRAVTGNAWPPITRLLMSISLSLALTIVCGLVLHLAQAITATGWVLVLGSLTLINCAIADYVQPARSRNGSHPMLPFLAACCKPGRALVLMAAAGLITILATALAIHDASSQHTFRYTELWMIPAGSDLAGTVSLGLRNNEAVAADYRVELMIDNRLVEAWNSIKLAPGQTWQANFDRIGIDRFPRAEAWAYKAGSDRSIYRRAWLAATSAPDVQGALR